jgi:hypothetical protein
VVALPADRIERLLPADEARIRETDPGSVPGACVGVLVAEQRAYGAFDLGLILGLPPQAAAYVLVEAEAQGGPLPVALRTGPCLTVCALPPSERKPLPRPLARARRGLLAASFRTPAMTRGRTALSPLGIALSFDALLLEEEKTQALALILAAEAEGLDRTPGAGP